MTQKSEKGKKGSGSFWVPEIAIDALIANRDITAQHIGAYLAIAKATEETGEYSTMGFKGIKKALRIGDRKARELVEDLCQFGKFSFSVSDLSREYNFHKKPPIKNLVFDLRAEGSEIELPEQACEAYPYRFRINIFDGVTEKKSNRPVRKVWFGNGLVEGYRSFRAPLRQLAICGQMAAKLLIKLYAIHDSTGLNGIPPDLGVYKDCQVVPLEDKDLKLRPQYRLYTTTLGLGVPKEVVEDYLSQLLLRGCGSIEKEAGQKRSCKALSSLEEAGFVYTAYTVYSGKFHEGGIPLYILHVIDTKRNTSKRKSENERGLASKINHIADAMNRSVTDSEGRFNGSYPLLAPSCLDEPCVTGIYKLRFRVTNPKNRSLEGYTNETDRQNEGLRWVKSAESFLKGRERQLENLRKAREKQEREKQERQRKIRERLNPYFRAGYR